MKKGHSLIEVMIVLIIFSIVLWVIFAIDYAGRFSWNQQEAQLQAQQDLRKASSLLVSELRQTRSTFLSSLTFSVPPDGAYYNAVSMRIPEDADSDGDVVDNNGNIEWSNIISYYLGGSSNSQLIRRVTDNLGNVISTEVIANNINQITFMRNPSQPNRIEVSCSTQVQSLGGQSGAASYTIEVFLRN